MSKKYYLLEKVFIAKTEIIHLKYAHYAIFW